MLLQACAGFMIPGVKVHVLDEPFAGINPVVKDTLIELILQENRTRGATFPDRQPRDGDHPPHLPARHRDDRRHASPPKARSTRSRGARTSSPPISGARSNERALLSVTDVHAGYLPGVDILRGLSLEARANEITLVIGPNGAGKSTLLRTVFAFLVAEPGQHRVPRRARPPGCARATSKRPASAMSRRTSTAFPPSRWRRTCAWAHGCSAATASGCGASSSAPTRRFRRSPRSGARAPANCPAGRAACFRSRAS